MISTPSRGLLVALLVAAALASGTFAADGNNRSPAAEKESAAEKSKAGKLPAFARGEYVPAGLGPRQPKIEVPFPGVARARSLPKGRAVLGVLIDADNRVVDSLVISCTDPIFGKALQDYLPQVTFQAAKFRGTAVPARASLSYTFELGDLNTNVMNEVSMIPDKIGAGKGAQASHTERELDRPLELTRLALPDLPAGLAPSGQAPVEVVVTFYIDETGQARLPNVEAAADPLLIPGAVAAVSRWTFKPATIKGQPVVVFTAKPVRFLPPDGKPR